MMRKFRSPHSLLAGVAVGVFLGLCISLFDNKIRICVDFPPAEEAAPKVAFYSSKLPPHLLRAVAPQNERRVPSPPNVWVRCAVLLESAGPKLWQAAEKSLAALRDTWAKHCNETLFFTDSSKLQQRYGDAFLPPSMRILLIQQGNFNPISAGLGPRDWTLISNLISFLSKLDRNGVKGRNGQEMGKNWTLITDGRSYVHLKNLRILLNQVDQNAAIIVGRKVPIQRGFWRSVLSHLLPRSSFSNWLPVVQFSLSSGESPLIFSQLSLRLLADHCSMVPFRWPYALINGPRHAGRVIGECAMRLGIALWDPVDQESRPLIVDTNLKLLFSRIVKNATVSGATAVDEQNQKKQQHNTFAVSMPQMTNCCSDRAIAFASLNHKELRLIDFGVHRLKVFGSR